ncbi:MAG: hypothetical protein LQ342_007123 [Letrouitia transgressa]|nr:MAG: hypothetical protein LQ342_007123 [Letrouitia transgressa]
MLTAFGSLYYLPTVSAEISPLAEVLNRLTTQYNPNPLPRWSLDHRLFRGTPNPSTSNQNSLAGNEKTNSASARYLQVLNLSHHPGQSYVAITSTTGPSQTRAGTPASSIAGSETSSELATVITIPAGAQSEEFIQLLTSKFGPLWQLRQNLTLTNGYAFEVGEVNVRAGEIKQGYGGTQLVRGVVVEVECRDGQQQHERDYNENKIRSFWEGLNIKGARECSQVPRVDELFVSVRQWCDILRIRA